MKARSLTNEELMERRLSFEQMLHLSTNDSHEVYDLAAAAEDKDGEEVEATAPKD